MKKSFFSSFFIVTAFSVLDRALGFFIKIYTSRAVGAEGMGVYQIAFSVFAVFLALSSGAISIVTSKLTARAKNDGISMAKIVTSSLVLSLTLSIILIILYALLFAPLGALLSQKVRTIVVFMLPTLVFSSVYASIRGNLWGNEKFISASIVEVVEQIARIGMIFSLFALGFDKLISSAIAFSVGSLASAIACIVFFVLNKGFLRFSKVELLQISSKTAPITLSHLVGALSGTITSLLIPYLFTVAGYGSAQATALFGASVGMAIPLLFIPNTLISSLSFMLLPQIGALWGKKDYKTINQKLSVALKFALFVSFFFLSLYLVGGKSICAIVYNDTLSGEFLTMISFCLIPLALESITFCVMNSLDMEYKAFLNGIVGYIVLWTVCLLSRTAFSFKVLAIAYFLSYLTITLLHFICIKRKIGLSCPLSSTLLKCVIITIATCILNYNLFSLTSSLSPLLSTILTTFVSVVFYTVFSLILNIFSINSVKLSLFKTKNKPNTATH